MSNQPLRNRTPRAVRYAGSLVTLEGAGAIGVALVLVLRALTGHDQSVSSGYGTAAWFTILGGGVLAAGIGLVRGRRWGRAIALVAQLLLLPVVWALLTDSHQPFFGILLAAVVVPTLVLLFSRPTSQWMAREYGDAGQVDSLE